MLPMKETNSNVELLRKSNEKKNKQTALRYKKPQSKSAEQNQTKPQNTKCTKQQKINNFLMIISGTENGKNRFILCCILHKQTSTNRLLAPNSTFLCSEKKKNPVDTRMTLGKVGEISLPSSFTLVKCIPKAAA